MYKRQVQKVGGDERNRTAEPLLARQVLSQLSYAPTFLLLSAKTCLVGLSGLEPLTSRDVYKRQLFILHGPGRLSSCSSSSMVPNAALLSANL